MPKRRMLRIVAYPDIEEAVPYAVRIIESHLLKEALNVSVIHLSASQEGRPHALVLRLPATANGLIAGLVRACGLPAESETEVDPQSITGAIVNVRFSVLPGNPQPQPIAFEPLRKEETHAQ